MSEYINILLLRVFVLILGEGIDNCEIWKGIIIKKVCIDIGMGLI